MELEVDADLLSPSEFAQRLPADTDNAADWRAALNWAREEIYNAFRGGAPAHDLVRTFTAVNDHVLRQAWAQFVGESSNKAALLAVGGFGRGELLPHSDIDLLILHAPDALDSLGPKLEKFIAFCWDMGLEIGQSVRTAAQCADEARDDLTVATNLMEARHLAGNSALTTAMSEAVGPDKLWPADAFFRAKFAEQKQRHNKFDDSAYKLEPNVKESPGGLRDIQMIVWITQRQYGKSSLEQLREHNLLTDKEAADLFAGRDFLWRTRFALHMLTGRCEDRLLFDHQIRIAELFGFEDQSHNLAVEQFMQVYYRSIKALSALNDILLQLINEQIFHRDGAPPRPLDDNFELRNDFIEARDPELFRRRPLALIEVFLLWATNDALGVKGIGAATLRLMRRDRNLIDDDLRSSLPARELFMQILRLPRGVLHSLRRMHRYGILARYIPAFGQVTGRMQYDLFHTLTVDEHTLFVVRNIRRLAVPEFRHEFPELSDIVGALAKPELITLGGFFHDIAKGRGGDHSELGENDAREFCLDHGLSTADADLVAWLVRNHLLMSLTAQRKDLSDPQVINEFALAVGTRQRLDSLYVLTVCDIRATNADLWNGFRAGLLRSLYVSTLRVLERGQPVQEAELIEETQSSARLLLNENGLPDARIDNVWSRFDGDYFLRHSADEVAWHTQAIANSDNDTEPLVLVRPVPRAGTGVFIYLPDTPHLFAATTASLAQHDVNILDARITATTDGYALDTFVIAESDGSEVRSSERRQELQRELLQALRSPGRDQLHVTRRVSLRRKHFTTPTQIYFTPDHERGHTEMELVTGDRPGLLSAVGRVFSEMDIELRAAKIGTIGERAEDIFFLANSHGKAIEDAAILHQLRERVTAAILNQLS